MNHSYIQEIFTRNIEIRDGEKWWPKQQRIFQKSYLQNHLRLFLEMNSDQTPVSHLLVILLHVRVYLYKQLRNPPLTQRYRYVSILCER